MTVKVRLINLDTQEWIGEGFYPGVPSVEDEIMFMPRDWHVYIVKRVRHWPIVEQTPDRELLGFLPEAPLVEVYVRFSGLVG